MQMKTRWGFFVVFLVSILSRAGIIHSKSSWTNPFVRVCWGTQSDLPKTCNPIVPGDATLPTEKIKNKIKKWVEEEYSYFRTGIQFAGWRNCSDDPSADVYVFLTEEYRQVWYVGGHTTIGKCGPNKPEPEEKAWVWLNLATQEDPYAQIVSKGIVIHEFGHLAGLLHEHISNPSPEINETPPEGATSVSTYDVFSIMDYYWLATLKRGFTLLEVESTSPFYRGDSNIALRVLKPNSMMANLSIRAGLSVGDVHALRCLYWRWYRWMYSCKPDSVPWN